MKRGPIIAGAGLLGVIALVPALVPSAVAADEQYGELYFEDPFSKQLPLGIYYRFTR